MENSKLERLKKCIRYLIFIEKISYESTQKDLSQRLQSEKSVISRALNGEKNYLTDNFLVKFNSAFENEFDLDWLISGNNKMIMNEQSFENTKNSVAIGRDANGSQIHITSQNIEEFIRITEKYQEHTDKMLAIIEKLINK